MIVGTEKSKFRITNRVKKALSYERSFNSAKKFIA